MIMGELSGRTDARGHHLLFQTSQNSQAGFISIHDIFWCFLVSWFRPSLKQSRCFVPLSHLLVPECHLP